MTKKELNAKRSRIAGRLQKYYEKKYDGRALLDAYIRITDLLNSMGCDLSLSKPYMKREYWDDPKNIEREWKNKNPIIGVDDNWDLVWKFGPNMTTQLANAVKTPIITEEPSKPSQPEYYKINIEWEPSEISPDVIETIKQFFNGLGIKVLESCDHKLTYRFESTPDGFKMLKRSVSVMLDILSNNSFNIGIYGEKII